MWKNLRIKRKRYASDGEYHFIKLLNNMHSREKEKYVYRKFERYKKKRKRNRM